MMPRTTAPTSLRQQANESMARSNLNLAVLAMGLLLDPGASRADPDHSKELHFSHPLFGESPSPDTKVRADYFFQNESGEATGEVYVLLAQLEILILQHRHSLPNLPQLGAGRPILRGHFFGLNTRSLLPV